MQALWPVLNGFGVSIGLIAAIGAQNAHVLRQGLARQQVALTVVVSAFIDTILMITGIFGMSALLDWIPDAAVWARYGGIGFLLIYGALCFKAALSKRSLMPADRVVTSPYWAFIAILAVSLLNPHVYLDTVILIGSIGSQFPDTDRIGFAVGAVSASWVWFIAMGFGARWLEPLFAKPVSWKILDGLIGCVMWFIAYHLWPTRAG